MKNNLWLTAALLITICLAAGCRHSAQNPGTQPETWLATDAEGCLKYYSSSFTRLSKEVGYDSVRTLYAGLMRRLPEYPEGNGDSVTTFMGRILAYYFNTVLLSPPDSTDYARTFREAVRLPDSLLRCPHRLYAGTLHYELLTLCGQLHMMADEAAAGDSLSRALLTLPVLDNDMRAIRVYHPAAWTAHFCCPELDVAITLEERAVAACRRGATNGGDGALFSRMGYFYRMAGRYEEAVRYIQEGVDYYENLLRKPLAVERLPDGSFTASSISLFTSIIRAYGDLASMYAVLGLYDKAIEISRIALHYSRQSGGVLLTDICRMRAEYFGYDRQADSCLAWLDSAYVTGSRRRVDDKFLRATRLSYIKMKVKTYPDSAYRYIPVTRAFLADSAKVTPKFIPELYHLHGLVLYHSPGHEREAIPYLEEAQRRYAACNMPVTTEEDYDILLKAYARTGQYGEMGKLYPPYAALRDSLAKVNSRHAIIAANVRYETGRKEQENRLLAAEVELKQHRLVFAWVLAGLLAVLLLFTVLYVRQRQRYHRRVSEARLSQISALLNARQKLQQQNESLAAELQKASEQHVSDTLRTQISTLAFSTDKEADFRRSFNAHYPNYLPSLRRIYAGLTRTDELIAMLLLLDQSNDDIALTLGIGKASVNKARSRLRKRLGLETEVKLEEYLKGI